MKLAAGLLIALALVGASVSPRVSRTSLVGLEKLTDGAITKVDINAPGQLLGATRGVYLDGYGAVFTTEVDLIAFAALNPFRQGYNEAELTKLRSQKLSRIDTLRKRMVEALIVMASQLEAVPASEQIALAVTIPYWPWEKSAGMPRQILIHAPKAALLNPIGLEKHLKVQEF